MKRSFLPRAPLENAEFSVSYFHGLCINAQFPFEGTPQLHA